MRRRSMFTAATPPRFPLAALYERTITAMNVVLRTFLESHPNDRPLFALPAMDVLVNASLRKVGLQLCRNNAARLLLTVWLKMEDEFRSDIGACTVLMLRAVLVGNRIEPEIASLSELGLAPKGGAN